MSFTDRQKKALEAKLNPAHVSKNPKGFDYLEGWFVIQEANRIFGHDGWNRETLEMEFLHQPIKNEKGNTCVSYRGRVRITIGDVVREGTGFGNGWAATETDAHESAIKEAETDAMKRAFMTLGNPFGLALYDKAKEGVATPADTATAAYIELIKVGHYETKDDAIAWFTNKDTQAEWKKNGLNKGHCDKLRAAINEQFPEQEAA